LIATLRQISGIELLLRVKQLTLIWVKRFQGKPAELRAKLPIDSTFALSHP